MSNSQQLFGLIKSLSENEKRNFRFYAQLHSGKGKISYLQLFEVLDNMKVYDESIAKKVFIREQKLAQFNPMIKYLFDVVINSLIIYSNKDVATVQLKKKVHSARILRDKGIYDKSRKLLIITKKEANKIEDFTTLLEVNKLLVLDLSDAERLKILREVDLVIKKIENIHFYDKTLIEMSSLFREKGMARGTGDVIAIKQLLALPLLNNEALALSNTAKQLFHQIKAIYYYFTGDYQKSLIHAQKRIACIATPHEFLEINFDSYLSCTHNLITLYFLLNFYKEANDVIDDLFFKFNNKRFSSILVKAKTFKIYALGKLELILKTGDYKNAQPFLIEIEKSTNKYKQYITTESLLDIHINISLIYFSLANYKDALKWLTNSLNYQKKSDRLDVAVLIHLLAILIHYEMGNKELITYLERSSRRYLKNERRLFKTESILLHFFRVIVVKMETKEDTLSAFKQLKEQLIEACKDPFESKLLQYFDFLSWVESKINRKTL